MLTDESGNSLGSVLPGLQALLGDARPPPTLATDLGPFVRLVPPDAAAPSPSPSASGAREQTQTQTAESESALCATGHTALSSTLPPTTSTSPPTFRRRLRSTPAGRRAGGRRQPSPPALRRPSRAEPGAQPTRAANSWRPPPLAELQPRAVSLLPDRSRQFSRARRAPREACSSSSYPNWYRLEGFLPPLAGLSFNERYSIRYSGDLSETR